MRRMKPIISIAISLAIASMALGQGATAKGNARPAEEQITALQAQIIEATLKGDISVFENYLSDDYIAIRGDGKLTTRAEELENLKSGVTKYESIEVREPEVRVYGDTAVYNSLSSIKAMINGKPYTGDVRNSRVWVKQNGNWKLILFQATRVATPSS
jgi:hypothetical protein